jgi:colanic acid biosynthesis glycosyl transferase WcaI
MRPDVVVTVEPAAFCMTTTWLAARLCGAKAWLHVQDLEVDAAFELGIPRQPTIQKVVLAVEAFLMRRLDDNHNERRSRFGIPGDKCIALYSGNIGAKQGLEVIIDAARQCADNSNLHFVICGQGAAYESLRDSSEGLSNFQWLPLQPLDQFNELMNCADVHLLPQRADAADLVMPSKLTGMLATGRPVVACASPGTQIADVVDQHGIVVPPGDSKAFCDAIVELAGNRSLRESLGKAARDYAVENFGRKAILDQFMDDLIDVCDEGKRRELQSVAVSHKEGELQSGSVLSNCENRG